MASGNSSSTHKRRSSSDSDDGMVNLDVLDCKICLDPLTVPVYQCKNGHVVCNICREKLDSKCPTCRLQVDCRCRPLEEMMESLKVKCKNWDYGCRDLLLYSNRDDHEKSCIYAKYLCHQPACKFREAWHEGIRGRLLQEVSSLVAQSADLSRVNQELSEKLSRREAELSALVTQNDDLRPVVSVLVDGDVFVDLDETLKMKGSEVKVVEEKVISFRPHVSMDPWDELNDPFA